MELQVGFTSESSSETNNVPFDPLELARRTEKIVCKGLKKKYDGFPVLAKDLGEGGHPCISPWSSGCCLRCFYCWAPWSRDYPEKYGKFYTPKEVVKTLYLIARKRKYNPKKVVVDLSGCESTIGKEHLLALIELLHESDFPQIWIDTNGILLGDDVHYIYDLARISAKFSYRISIKAGTPESFEKRTGAKGQFYELPFQAIRHIVKLYAPLIPLSIWVMADPRIMPNEEWKIIRNKLRRIDPRILNPPFLNREVLFPYKRSVARLKKAGYTIQFTDQQYKFAETFPTGK